MEGTMGLPAIFQYEDKEMRVVTDEQGEPWWVAVDVCNILTLSNPTEAIRGLDDDEKSTLRITEGGPEINIVSEPGLYSLIIRSNKKEAKDFKRWITHDVIPSIRKTGSYSLAVPKTLPDALRAYALEIERRQEIESKLAIAAPKAEFFDAVADSKDAVDLGRAAKVLNCGMGRNRLFQVLRDKKILMETNIPYQTFVDRGYFRVIEQKYTKPDGSTHITFKTLVYQRGLAYIQKTLKAA